MVACMAMQSTVLHQQGQAQGHAGLCKGVPRARWGVGSSGAQGMFEEVMWWVRRWYCWLQDHGGS